ncbi:hypothetical protein [Microtetraspora niveoalba]|uniref:hypothetical protein n=1 Tax=Microtetraspora niveoalba TaxID=46175 RepID=UPI000833E8B6|nr:hypothetical protein [Microtetraspora niveoalba]
MLRMLVRGAAGGALATVALTAVSLAGDQAGLMRDRPSGRPAPAPSPRRTPRRSRPAESLAHFGFGVASGVVFCTLTRERASLPLGVGYALTAWLASRRGWVPRIGILPPESRDDSCRAAVLAAGHVVYGMVLVATLNRLD